MRGIWILVLVGMVLGGCSLVTQPQRTVLSVAPDGVVSIEASGYRLGDMAMWAMVDPDGTMEAAFVADKSELYWFLDSQSTKALAARDKYDGLLAGGMTPAMAAAAVNREKR